MKERPYELFCHNLIGAAPLNPLRISANVSVLLRHFLLACHHRKAQKYFSSHKPSSSVRSLRCLFPILPRLMAREKDAYPEVTRLFGGLVVQPFGKCERRPQEVFVFARIYAFGSLILGKRKFQLHFIRARPLIFRFPFS